MSNLIKKVKTQSGDAQIDYKALANLPTSDKTLTQEGSFADAKEVGDRLSKLSDEIENLSKNGLTTEQINALDGMFKVTAFSDDPSSAYNAFKTAFGITTESIPATGISLDKSTLSFTDTTSQTLTATVEPSNSTDSVTWETSDAGVATVSSGVVSPVSNGSCTITAKAGSYSASCEVTVAVESEIVTYTITNNLTNVSTDNPVTTVNENSGYTANLTADTEYTIDSVTVTMGGIDITSTAYSNGIITIDSVTGNVIITASAVSLEEESGDIVYLDYVELSGGAYFDTGMIDDFKKAYEIGIMLPESFTDTSSNTIRPVWGATGRNNSSLADSDYYDDAITIPNAVRMVREIAGNKRNMSIYKDNSSYLLNSIPWYFYTSDVYTAIYKEENMVNLVYADNALNNTREDYSLDKNEFGNLNSGFTFDYSKHAPTNIWLGKINDTAGTITSFNNNNYLDGIKYYVYKVWSEGGELLMHLRPAKRGTDVGMYDEVSSSFFKSTTGTVTAGNEVSE